MTTTIEFSDVLDYIIDRADDEDIDRLYEAIKVRNKALRARAAAAVRIGADVTLTAVSPKYLVGMTGTVVGIKGQRADVELDEASTSRLRIVGRRRFFIAPDAKRYIVQGVPMSSCSI